MATHIDDAYYRTQIRKAKTKIRDWEQKTSKYQGLKWVPAQIKELKELPEKMQALLDKALELRGKEFAAEQELAQPSQGMYEVLSGIYGGMLFFQISDAIIQQIFPLGRPEPKRTPPAELQMVLSRLSKVFENDLKGHVIVRQKGEEIKKLVTNWEKLAEQERQAEQSALNARAQLAAINQEWSQGESVLRHLARAETVTHTGFHAELFPSSRSQPQNGGETPTADTSVATA